MRWSSDWVIDAASEARMEVVGSILCRPANRESGLRENPKGHVPSHMISLQVRRTKLTMASKDKTYRSH